MTHPTWPFFDLRVRTPRLELRYVDDTLAVELARVAAGGIHEPGFQPFLHPWSAAESPKLERNVMQYYWKGRAALSADRWSIELAVIADGRVVGVTALMADYFAILRQFETGSWLGREYQGRGIGREMRQASLYLGFAGLDALFATTGAWDDNQPSLGVTRRLGYTASGRRRMIRGGQAGEMLGFRMSRAEWEDSLRRDDIAIDGLEPCLELLGAAEPP